MLSRKGERHEHTVPEFWRVPSKETHRETNHAPQNGGNDRDHWPYLTDIEKDRRNPPEMEKLELISQILMLNDEDKTTMYDLVGKKRNSVAPDLPDYIMEHDYVSAALRTARDLDASEADWLKFVEELRQRKG